MNKEPQCTYGTHNGYRYDYDDVDVFSFNLHPKLPDDIKNLKLGDKVIFIRHGGTVSVGKGNIFTFSNWLTPLLQLQKCHYIPNHWLKEPIKYFQCLELLQQGNTEHGMDAFCIEVFNPLVHKDYVLMDADRLEHDKAEFISKYGA